MADLFGGDLGDRIIGTNADDFIVTLFPDTLVRAGGGDDEILGAEGRDRIFGGPGADIINSGAGPDVVHGGTGDDAITGYQDNDRLYGNSGNDDISGAWGHDVLYGNGGNDSLGGHGGHDRLIGGDGRDSLSGDNGDDYLSGGTGADRLHGGPGADVLLGGAGRDHITTGDGLDVVRAGRGNDWIYLAGNTGTIHGGPGTDVLQYDGANGFTVDFTLAPAEGGVTIRSIEIINTTANGGILLTMSADVLRQNLPSGGTLEVISGGDESRIVMTDAGWSATTNPDGSVHYLKDGVALLVSVGVDFYQTLDVSGTDGNDLYSAGDLYLFRGDAGTGIDTLALNGANEKLDLSTNAGTSVTGIEILDIGGTGSNLLVFNTALLADLTPQIDSFIANGNRQLLIRGQSDDFVTCLDDGWVAGDSVQIGAEFYTSYTHASTDLQLFIDSDISTLVG